MDKIVPRFPIIGPPETWDALTLMAATVFLEAEGEPNEGKVAVAWVIRNRMDRRKKSTHEIVLAPWQFSCWNTDYRHRADARLVVADGPVLAECWRAAAGAFWRLLPDPTGGDHYLNVDVVKRTNDDKLPSWFDQQKVVAVVGNHHFLNLET